MVTKIEITIEDLENRRVKTFDVTEDYRHIPEPLFRVYAIHYLRLQCEKENKRLLKYSYVEHGMDYSGSFN